VRVPGVDGDGLLVDWGARLGAVRHPWSEAGARFALVPRRAWDGIEGGGRGESPQRFQLRTWGLAWYRAVPGLAVILRGARRRGA
jgi:hypothetical protein